ncbi:hypothetical protein Goshw_022149 [Gossypium schwendimanii]|uniref:Phosphoribosyltransferase domain-containing protein n=1 Tax=Gossypium schwendimanii TaxID=34291 RepID=A0A7J9ME15_GOSSC|nr:hypothetical protein [Gossypium schwendimanii]
MSMSLDSHIEKVLWTQDQILDRVAQIASQITLDFKAAPDPPLFVGVATGAFLFLADLVKRVQFPLFVDLVRAQSYGSGTLSNGVPSISLDLKLDVKGKHVEDIVDTGCTLSCLIEHLEAKGVSSVSICAFLDKPTRRKVHIKLVGDGKFYKGFEVKIYSQTFYAHML